MNDNQDSRDELKSGSHIDINKLSEDSNFVLSLKVKKNSESIWDNLREMIPIFSGGLISITVVIFSLTTLNSKEATPDDKKNAQSMVSLITGLTVGYGAGKTKENKN